MDKFKRWLTFHLVKVASQLDGEMFMRLCEVAVLAQHREAIETAAEMIRDAARLEQEHDYDYNFEDENYDTPTKPTTH